MEPLNKSGDGWRRTEGMMISSGASPQEVADYLAQMGVVVCLEWYPRTPHLLSITVLSDDDGYVGLIADGAGGCGLGGGCTTTKSVAGGAIVPGMSLQQLASNAARNFRSEVLLGTARVNEIPELIAEAVRQEAAHQGRCGTPLPGIPAENASKTPGAPGATSMGIRPDERRLIADITPMRASTIPLLAAFQSRVMAATELDGDRRLVLQMVQAGEADPFNPVWDMGELPVVSLSNVEGEYRMTLITGLDEEDHAHFSWRMESRLIYGAVKNPAWDVQEMVEELLAPARCAVQVAAAVPGVNAGELTKALNTRGEEGFVAAATALGIPESAIEFLLDKCPLNEVQGVELHEARGMSNAIGRTVDIMFHDTESVCAEFWNSYHHLAIKKPWVIKTAAAIEAAAGLGLVMNGLRSSSPRRKLSLLGAVAGVVLVLDSLAELSLAKYLALREERHAGDLDDDYDYQDGDAHGHCCEHCGETAEDA